MKVLLYLVTIICISSICCAQDVYFIENQSLKKITGEQIDSVRLDYTLDWDVITDNEIIAANCYKIIVKTIENKKEKTLFKSDNGSILELASTEKYCYFTAYNSEEKYFEKKEMNLYKIDLQTNSIERVNFADSLNYSNINITPSGQYISFVHHSNIGTSNELYFFIVINFLNGEIDVVDTAYYMKGERFLGSVGGNLSHWDGSELYYYKFFSQTDEGKIFKYSVSEKKKKVALIAPDKRLECFSYDGESFYFTNGNCIYKYFNNEKEILYKSTLDEAFIFQHLEVK